MGFGVRELKLAWQRQNKVYTEVKVMSRKIRWGFMGAGRIAGWFATGMSVLEDAERYAIASRTLEKGERFAREYGFSRAYGSYEEMLKDPDVDIVYVATPVAEHYSCVKRCLEAGKNVLCEKALTVNAVQAAELVEMAREKNLFFMEAAWTKCQPVFLKVKEWVESGLIGDIQGMDVRFYTKAGEGHRLYSHELAGGALLDLGFYPVMYACALMGHDPKQIISHMAIGEKRVDYLDSIILEYEGGGFAHLSCGLGCDKEVSAYISGTKGRIAIRDEFFFQATKVTAYDFDNNVLAEFEGPFLQNGYEFEAIEAMECLRAGLKESKKVPLDETLAVMKILDICRKNAGFQYDFEA